MEDWIKTSDRMPDRADFPVITTYVYGDQKKNGKHFLGLMEEVPCEYAEIKDEYDQTGHMVVRWGNTDAECYEVLAWQKAPEVFNEDCD